MRQPDETDVSRETIQLLNELDNALLHSSALRAVLEKSRELQRLESVTGPSRLTRALRREISLLQNQLGKVRA